MVKQQNNEDRHYCLLTGEQFFGLTDTCYGDFEWVYPPSLSETIKVQMVSDDSKNIEGLLYDCTIFGKPDDFDIKQIGILRSTDAQAGQWTQLNLSQFWIDKVKLQQLLQA